MHQNLHLAYNRPAPLDWDPESLLRSLVLKFHALPSGARPIFEMELLPAALEILARGASGDRSWCCWFDHSDFWFFIGERAVDKTGAHGRPVLRYTAFDRDGAIIGAGYWIRSRANSWHVLPEVD